MIQKIEIEVDVPNGKRAIWKDNAIVFIEDKLPKTWEEFCDTTDLRPGEAYNWNGGIEMVAFSRKRDAIIDRNVLPSEVEVEKHLVFMQLHQLRDRYRQGWIPDWYNYREGKWQILQVEGKYRILIGYTTPRFLSFQTKELAKEFLENFKDLIEQAEDLI